MLHYCINLFCKSTNIFLTNNLMDSKNVKEREINVNYIQYLLCNFAKI